MARRYYRRRTVTVRPKKKWASNIVLRNYLINSTTPTPVTVLVENQAQAGTPTPVIVKAGNFKVNADIFLDASAPQNYVVQIMALVIYVPESLVIANNSALGTLVAAHPEYIMAWRQFDFTYSGSTTNLPAQQVSFSSRLKRNLNSGDKIVFGILSTDSGVTVVSIQAAVTAQYWTCAN